MYKFFALLLITIFIQNCSLNKVIKRHGVPNLEKKSTQIILNETNKNDVLILLGPPSTYSLGKNDINLFKKIVKNSFILSSITGLIISIIYFLINKFAIQLMSNIEVIKSLSSSYAIWLIIMPLISSFCYQFDGIFIGVSQTKELRNAMIFSVFSYVVISLILADLLGNTGIWISLCLFMILRALSLYYYLDKIYLRFNVIKSI